VIVLNQRYSVNEIRKYLLVFPFGDIVYLALIVGLNSKSSESGGVEEKREAFEQ